MSILSFGDRFPALTVARVNGPALELPDAFAGRPGLVLVVPGDALGPRRRPGGSAYLSRLRQAEDGLASGVRVVVLSAGRAGAEAVAKWLGPRLTVAYLSHPRCLTDRLGGLHPDPPPERSTDGDYAGFLLAPNGTVQVSVYTNDPLRSLCPARVIALLHGVPDGDCADSYRPGTPTLRPQNGGPRPQPDDERKAELMSDEYQKTPEKVAALTPEQYRVTQDGATEPAFRNAYWDNKEAGIYVDVVSGEPLFASVDKYDSNTGWPSFTKPLAPDRIVSLEDRSYGMRRTEVRSAGADSHLGHVFDDGPFERGGKRYCLNSAALRFVPVADLEREGYGKYRALFGGPGSTSPGAPEAEEAS